jgi:hypothetical protein
MSWEGFFSEDPEAIVRALRSLSTQLTEISHGEVTDAAILSHGSSPHRAGIVSEAIFGPRQEPGERDRRWGHIALVAPCLHPRLVPLAAELLGNSQEAVLAVARGEAWSHAGEIFLPPESEPKLERGVPIWEWEPSAVEELEPGIKELYRVNTQIRRLGALPKWAEEHFGTEAAWFEEALGGTGPLGLRAALATLPSDRAAAFEARFGIAPTLLVTDCLPVPPPGARPFSSRPGGFEHPGPTNAAFAHLVFLNQQLAQGREYETSVLTLRELERCVQLAFEEVVLRMSGQVPKSEAPMRPDIAGKPSFLERFSNHDFSEEPDCHWFRKSLAVTFDGSSALVQLPTATFPVDLAGGKVGEPTRSVGLRLLASSGSHAVFVDPVQTALHVLDVARGSWCEARPEALSADLLAATKRWTHAGLIVSACGRFYMDTIYIPHSVYGSDGFVVRSLDGEPVFEPGGVSGDGPLSWFRDDGVVRVFDDPYEAFEACHPQSGVSGEALVLSESGDFLTLIDNVLTRGSEAICGLAFEIHAAAFDPTGSRLLLCGTKALTLLDVRQQPRLIGSFSLLPLLDQMATTRWRGSTRALSSALCRYGWLSKIAERELSELKDLTAMDESWELQPLGAPEATRILRMARGVRARNEPLVLPVIKNKPE